MCSSRIRSTFNRYIHLRNTKCFLQGFSAWAISTNFGKIGEVLVPNLLPEAKIWLNKQEKTSFFTHFQKKSFELIFQRARPTLQHTALKGTLSGNTPLVQPGKLSEVLHSSSKTDITLLRNLVHVGLFRPLKDIVAFNPHP